MGKNIFYMAVFMLLSIAHSIEAARAGFAPQVDHDEHKATRRTCGGCLRSCWQRLCCRRRSEDVLLVAAWRIPRKDLRAVMDKLATIERDDRQQFFAFAYAIHKQTPPAGELASATNFISTATLFQQLQNTLSLKMPVDQQVSVTDVILRNMIRPNEHFSTARRTAYSDGQSEAPAAFKTVSFEDFVEQLTGLTTIPL